MNSIQFSGRFQFTMPTAKNDTNNVIANHLLERVVQLAGESTQKYVSDGNLSTKSGLLYYGLIDRTAQTADIYCPQDLNTTVTTALKTELQKLVNEHQIDAAPEVKKVGFEEYDTAKTLMDHKPEIQQAYRILTIPKAIEHYPSVKPSETITAFEIAMQPQAHWDNITNTQ